MISSSKSSDSDGALCSAFSHHGEWILRVVAALINCGHTPAFDHVQDLRVQLKAKQFGVPSLPYCNISMEGLCSEVWQKEHLGYADNGTDFR